MWPSRVSFRQRPDELNARTGPSDPRRQIRRPHELLGRRQCGGEHCLACRRTGTAMRMSESGCADTRHLTSLRRDIENDVVRVAWAGYTGRHVIELQLIARTPGNVVICAGRVAADADAAD